MIGLSAFRLTVATFILVSAFSFNAHAHTETVMQLIEHEFSHQGKHHTYSRDSGNSAPMGEDDSLFGDPSALQSKPLCTAQYFKGDSPVFINAKLSAKTELGCFDNFTVMHSGVTRTPLWSAEHLTRDSIMAAAGLRRQNPFHDEPRLPAGERAELSDYARSGFDRGHMSPNKDMPTKLAQWQCFTLANMIPQNPNNNQVLWEGIESAVRKLAKKNGELYVVTGPLFIGGSLQSLHGRVMVPTQIYKAVLDPQTGRAAAYLVNNEAGMDYKVISVSELERMSGIEVFPGISQRAKEDAMSLPRPTPHRHESN